MRYRFVAFLGICACQGGGDVTSSTEQGLTSCIDLVASQDATLSRAEMHKNFGHDHTLRLGPNFESVVGFNLSAIPAAAAIDSATMSVYVSDISCDDSLDIYRATAAWQESSVTYQSFAQHFDHQIVGSIVAHHGHVQKSVDLKALVRSWQSGAHPNDGIVLAGISHGEATLVSREGGTHEQRPTLHVCYSVPDNHCAPNPCENGASCQNDPTGYTCQCAPGFTGTNCEVNVDDCADQPCQNGGTCVDGANSYTCQCAPGFTGASCETNIDDCDPQPCQNGGVCEDGVASYTCQCAAGFDGTNCEHNIDDCAGAPCQNGGTCADGIAGYTCTCATGFTGTTCEINIDDCTAQSCNNGGTCIDGIASFTCACPPDWGGDRCDINLNTCGQQPCLNGATCTNGFGTYTCACAPGFEGTNCEVDINDCVVNQCLNGGVCVDGVNSFTCSCPAGLGGSLCDQTIGSWLHATAGGGIATVVWGQIANATSYVITSDHPVQQVTSSACSAGVCSVQLQASDGDSTIAVTAVNSLGSSALGTVTAHATTGVPPAPPALSAGAGQSGGVVSVTFSWQNAEVDNGIRVLEIDPVTGAELTRFNDFVDNYFPDPFSGGGPPPAYCELEFFCSATMSSIPQGTRVLQVAFANAAGGTARTPPFTVVVPGVDNTPPPTPTGLHVISVTDTTATLSWTASAASDVASYWLSASGVFAGEGGCAGAVCTGTVTNLRWGIDYAITVSAVDVANNHSGQSSAVDVVLGSTGPLSAPSIISLTPDDNMLLLRFSANLAEHPGRFHVLYRPAAGGAETDLVMDSSACVVAAGCQIWIQNLASIPYAVQVQTEGAPGNLSPRSAAAVATPTAVAIPSVDFLGCYNNNLTRVHMTMQPPFDSVWTRGSFPPDLASFIIRLHVAIPMLDAEGRFIGDSFQDFDTTVSASTACDGGLDTCQAIVNVPVADPDYGQTGVQVVAVDRNGNVGPWPFVFGIGFPGGGIGSACGNGNF